MPTESDNFFKEIFNAISNFYNEKEFFESAIGNLVEIFLTIVGSYLLAWIMYRGYQIMWGKNNDNIKDFLWDAFLKFIFVMICMFPDEWLNLVAEALKEMREINIRSFDIVDSMQKFWDLGIAISNEIDKNTSNALLIWIAFCTFAILIGLLIGAFGVYFPFIINLISFSVLLALTPFAFYCLIFGNFLKSIFKQWWNLILSNILALIFLNVMMYFIFNFLISPLMGNAVYYVTSKDDFASDLKAVSLVIICGISLKIFTGLILSLTEKLIGVSFENSVGGSVRSGLAIAGAVGGLGLRGAVGFAKPHGEALTKLGSFVGKKAINKFKSNRSNK